MTSLREQEEREFLAPFFARAQSGALTTAEEIKRAFEARVGHVVPKSTIYRLLDRHGWRKLVPRPKHPQASKQAQDQLKKTLRGRLRRSWRHEPPTMSVRSC
jgi:transposase